MKEEFGYTTGTYASVATKAALKTLLDGSKVEGTVITLPRTEKAFISVNYIENHRNHIKCSVIKKSIDGADVTDKMEIIAEVSLREDRQIVIDGGIGVGRITKPGLQLPIGEAAINPVPRKMISSAIRELTSMGVNVLISVPKGEKIAEKTTNARLGIIGGISIIGTTGIMKAKSLSSFKLTIYQQLNFCKKNRFKEIIITPGNISEDGMRTHFRNKIHNQQIVQSGDFLGFTLKHAFKINLPFILAGHPGKLAKVLSGHFQTHYSKSPPANNNVINLIYKKIENNILKELKESTTVEGMINILQKHKKGELLNNLAVAIGKKIQEYLKSDSSIPIILFNMNKEIIGFSKAGAEWGQLL